MRIETASLLSLVPFLTGRGIDGCSPELLQLFGSALLVFTVLASSIR